MKIQRVRRLRLQDEPEKCECCNQPVERGYTFFGLAGSRSQYISSICDDCLDKAKKSKIGFYPGIGGVE